MNTGGYYSLKTYGSQDVWVKTLSEEAFNLEAYLKDKHYQRVYQKLAIKSYKKLKLENGIRHEIRLSHCCHLIHKVDAYIKKSNQKLKDVLKRIEVIYGGQLFDKIASEDIETQINMNAAILKSNRKVTYIDSSIIVPLHMAPFHDMNLIAPQSAYHDLDIRFESTCEEDIELYADCYYIKDYKSPPVECLTLQQEDMGGGYSLKKGTNTFKLYFNHPTVCVYFWGFDKRHITKIQLKLNTDPRELDDTTFYEGGIEPLEYYKHSRGITEEPICIFFTDVDFNKRPNSTVNFSRLDYPELIIESKVDSPFYLVGLHYQGYRCQNGMVGLVFSK